MIKLFLQNSETGATHDVAQLVSGIKHSTSLAKQPGKLTFTMLREVDAPMGSTVALSIEGVDIFFGRVFTTDEDENNTLKITAYDNLRYLQNENSLVTSGASASQIFAHVCTLAGLRYRVDAPTGFICPAALHEDKRLYDIVYTAIQQTNVATGRYYYLRDAFGTLAFDELLRGKTNLVIGESSLLTGFAHSTSIDKSTYNTVKVTREKEKADGKGWDAWVEYDSSTAARWGTLQMVEKIDVNANDAQARKLAADLLKLHNRPDETLKLKALGVPGLIAGAGVTVDIRGMRRDVWITSAEHSWDGNAHTMNLDVFV